MTKRSSDIAIWRILRVLAFIGFAGVYAPTLKCQSVCIPAPEGLVSWWKGESNLLDQIGGNSGVADADLGYSPGEVGLAFDFSGGDIIDVGKAANLRLQDFSLEGWISTLNVGIADGLCTFFGFGEGGCQFGMDYESGELYLGLNQEAQGGRNPSDEVVSTSSVTDTNFHHLAVTKSGTNVYFYIDGVGELAPPFLWTFAFTSDAGIGATGDGYAPFDGKIDEFSVYNRALTAIEIQAIYKAGSFGKCLTLSSPYIFEEPTNMTVFGGDTASFAVVATGAQPLSFQWSFDGTNISEATNGTFTITNAQASNNGTYSVLVSNKFGPLSSSNAVLTVDLIPDISAQPVDQTAGAYYPASFSVAAGGPLPLQYQWMFDGTNIGGATDSTLLIPTVLPANAGTYSVILGTPPNTTNSSNAILTVTLPPATTILTQPASHIGVVNDYTTFSVTAQSESPVPTYYQWTFNGTNMSDATNSELIISNLTLANAGTYAVQVLNPFIATNSQPAVLTMIPAPTGTNRIVANLDANELSQAVQAGGSVTFVCNGTIALSQPLALSHDVVVNGSNYTVVISGGNGTQVLAISSRVNVTLRNLTLSEGNAAYGGAVSNGGALNASNVRFVGNTAGSMGGAIYNMGFVALTNVIFSGNAVQASGSSDAYGGGLFNQGGTVAMQKVTFNNNIAQGGTDDEVFEEVAQGYGFGGALCSIGGWIGGSDIECTNNAALAGQGAPRDLEPGPSLPGLPGAGEGGAFYLSNCIAMLSQGLFVGNSNSCSAAYNEPAVDCQGGAIFNAGWTTLNGIEFISNNCPGVEGISGQILHDDDFAPTQGGPAGGGMGGGVYNMGLLEMSNCMFTLNTVNGGSGGPGGTCVDCMPQQTGPVGTPGNALGGALANFGTVAIVSSMFLDNSASGPGADVGTIYSVSNLQIETNTTISPDTVETITNPAVSFFALEPQSQTVVAGGTVTFLSLAVGSPAPTYQWAWNGTNISSATGSVLVLTNAQPAESGTYWVDAMNSSGSETSAPVVLTITEPTINLSGINLGNGQFSITETATSAATVVLESSSNLFDWQPLQTNPTPFTFVDTNAAGIPFRFYRAVLGQ